MKAANTSKKKGTMYWGANTAFLLQLGDKQRNWVGNCPLVYLLKEALTDCGKVNLQAVLQLEYAKIPSPDEVETCIIPKFQRF